MKQIYENCWYADEGKTFIRKSDGYDMGAGIQLGYINYSEGEKDIIDNYEEVEVAVEQPTSEKTKTKKLKVVKINK